MMPLRAAAPAPIRAPLTEAEDAIVRSVLYAALFDYPLTLAQLRQTLVGVRMTASDILATARESPSLAVLIDSADGYVFPAGCSHFLNIRRSREARSRRFLLEHQLLLRMVAACPWVRLVALSGSIAHLNLDAGGDLDLFIVTRGQHVWMTAVLVVLLSKLLGRRRTLCANFIVADTALRFSCRDLFTANQIIGLKPVAGGPVFEALLEANPFVHDHYPNFHSADAVSPRVRRDTGRGWFKAICESVLHVPAMAAERICRKSYGAYLRRRSERWRSPEQVVLGDLVLKLHTQSHRQDILQRFDSAVRDTLD